MELLSESIIKWLLEEENPSIRYWTLLDILQKSSTSKIVKEAQKQIRDSLCVKKILKAMNPEGYWEKTDDVYLPKYTASTHNLLILSQLGMTRTVDIEKAIEHVYRFQRNSGHFLMKLPKTEKGYDSVVKDGCCFDGNILLYLIHFGYLEDPRTQKLLKFQEDYYSDDEGGWKCRAYPIDPTKVYPANCYMGRVKMLRALATIPESKRSKKIQNIIKNEIEVILENSIYLYLRHPDGTRKEKAGWKRFGFPLFYQSDVLEVLSILTKLNVKDERMQDAIDLVVSTRQKDGTWLLKNSFNGKMICDIEEKGKSSKWITLRAIQVLNHYLN